MSARERLVSLLAAELRGPSLAAEGRARAIVDALIAAPVAAAPAAEEAARLSTELRAARGRVAELQSRALDRLRQIERLEPRIAELEALEAALGLARRERDAYADRARKAEARAAELERERRGLIDEVERQRNGVLEQGRRAREAEARNVVLEDDGFGVWHAKECPMVREGPPSENGGRWWETCGRGDYRFGDGRFGTVAPWSGRTCREVYGMRGTPARVLDLAGGPR